METGPTKRQIDLLLIWWWMRGNSMWNQFMQRNPGQCTHLMQNWLLLQIFKFLSNPASTVIVYNTFTANYVFMSYMTFLKNKQWQKNILGRNRCGDVVLMLENHRQPCNLSRSFALRGMAVFVHILYITTCGGKPLHKLPQAVSHTHWGVFPTRLFAV